MGTAPTAQESCHGAESPPSLQCIHSHFVSSSSVSQSPRHGFPRVPCWAATQMNRSCCGKPLSVSQCVFPFCYSLLIMSGHTPVFLVPLGPRRNKSISCFLTCTPFAVPAPKTECQSCSKKSSFMHSHDLKMIYKSKLKM